LPYGAAQTDYVVSATGHHPAFARLDNWMSRLVLKLRMILTVYSPTRAEPYVHLPL
jgi:hypothetical protein